ncbi:hypothetical protein [Ralstonia soli]|uniref:Uncharacterized protein n=1 Tax=Ralstonia soli TaxID=2953896 RepID=A0ABT1AQQ4_9RALS|nr:hypothetical protein [Ralstonia soli]MCO5400746.1 hypothetical protein [Ralstonia soli]
MTREEFQKGGEALHAARDWLLDASQWHPVAGTVAHLFTDSDLASLLEGAQIDGEQDIGGPVVVLYGWLSPNHGMDGTGGGYAFLCVREKGEGDDGELRHMVFMPTRPYEPGDEYGLLAGHEDTAPVA